NAGFKEVQHQLGLGATAIVWGKLKNGELAIYPEYNATISKDILKLKGEINDNQLRDLLQKEGIGMTEPLGFDDNYALVMQKAKANQLGITRISDLLRHPELRFGPTAEFLKREDGFPGVSAKYGLHFQDVASLEHSIGYAKLKSDQI